MAFVAVSVALTGACGSGGEGDDSHAGPPGVGCGPTQTSGLAEVFQGVSQLGPVVSAHWCAWSSDLGDDGRDLGPPGPSDHFYYAVVRLADTTTVQKWGPWRPAARPPEVPVPLRSFLPADGQWSSNEAGVRLDFTSATAVMTYGF
ncbi:hypothetical protein [Embleya scabrispora]|uniref:hypothetical protein n=1 Tax=Embleya scabrispora TaxID=159449 RepID=UPI00117D926C|nr:hypothetical protein [Embleya scabrispora]